MNGKRQAALSMRIAPAVRDKLVQSAKANGRSITQEADRLLERAFHDDEIAARLDRIEMCIRRLPNGWTP